MLCSRCQSIHFRPQPDGGLFYVLHKTRDSFVNSLSAGCRFCSLIELAVGRDNPKGDGERSATASLYEAELETVDPDSEEMGQPLIGDDHVVLRLESPQWPANTLDGWKCGFDATKISIANSHTKKFLVMIPKPNEEYLEAQERQWSKYQRLLTENPNTAPKALFRNTEVAFNASIAAMWEMDCSDYHTSCFPGRRPGSGSAVPYRLIDVQAAYPFLVETADPNFEKDQYIALSYCWGQGARFMTLKKNVKEYHTSLPYDEMPKTFNDAIYVTGSLGYRYLWIDALCIIQDDGADVAREIVRMDKIYQNAVFTIAAQGAAGVGDGLFNAAMHPLARMACTISLEATLSKPAQHGSGAATFVLDSSEEPVNYLSGRGWVLQESILAPRMLLFGPQMRWRCVEEDILTEIRPVPTTAYFVPPNAGSERGSEARTQPMRSLIYQAREGSSTTAKPDLTYEFRGWRNMVLDYTRRALTFPSDVLRALVGLSRAYTEILGVTYFAGVWKEALVDDLAWFVDWDTEWRTSPVPRGPYWERDGEMLVQDLQALAKTRKAIPSWSWASAGKAAVEYRDQYYNMASWNGSPLGLGHGPKPPQIIDAFCLSEDPVHIDIPTPPGKTKPWGITLRAPLKKAVLRFPAEVPKAANSFDTFVVGDQSKTLLLAQNAGKGVGNSLGCAVLDCPLEVALFGEPVVLQKKDPGEETGELDVVCLPLMGYKHKQDAVSQIGCVILVEDGQSKGLYSRIGFGALPVECWDGQEEMVQFEIV